MSYPVPTLYVSKSNAQGTPGLENPQYWGDIDANRVSGAFVEVVGDVNAVSGSLTALSGGYTTLSGNFLVLSGNLNNSASVWNNMAGLAASSTLTPTASFLRSPNGNVWQITIDNSGVLSSTLT